MAALRTRRRALDGPAFGIGEGVGVWRALNCGLVRVDLNPLCSINMVIKQQQQQNALLITFE